MNQKIKQFSGFLAGLAVLLVLDQWTKNLAVAHLKDKNPYVVWDGVFQLLYSENRGAAFGILQGKQGFFFIIGAIVIIAVTYLLIRMPYSSKYIPLGLCALGITAGAVGNMIDRLSQGYVVDFLYFSLIDFPIFNVADCYVTVATGVLAVLILFYYKDQDLDVFSFKGKGGT